MSIITERAVSQHCPGDLPKDSSTKPAFLLNWTSSCELPCKDIYIPVARPVSGPQGMLHKWSLKTPTHEQPFEKQVNE